MTGSPLNADVAQLGAAATALDSVCGEVLTSLGRYVTMNQNLTGTSFSGTAALASMATTEDINNTGRQVSERFQSVINMIKRSGQEYQAMEDANRAALGGVTAT